MTARLYLRRNGTFGASVSDCLDTGHCIHEDSGKFTVWSIDSSGAEICIEATRAEAEKAIADDWKRS